MADTSNLGKKAEGKIKEWLDRPKDGYSFDRIKDQMTGFYGSSNICDFTCFKSPYMYYIESKATWEDRFDFNMLTQTQHDGLLAKSNISNVFGIVIVLFASYKRAFIFDIRHIAKLESEGIKSLNIKKYKLSRVGNSSLIIQEICLFVPKLLYDIRLEIINLR